MPLQGPSPMNAMSPMLPTPSIRLVTLAVAAIVALVIYAVILMRGAMTAEDVAEELPSEAELVGAT